VVARTPGRPHPCFLLVGELDGTSTDLAYLRMACTLCISVTSFPLSVVSCIDITTVFGQDLVASRDRDKKTYIHALR
jgi:hypothetical protein